MAAPGEENSLTTPFGEASDETQVSTRGVGAVTSEAVHEATTTWGPTRFARVFGGAEPWSLTVRGAHADVTVPGFVPLLDVNLESDVSIHLGPLWSRVTIQGREPQELRGLGARGRRALLKTIECVQQERALERRVQELRGAFDAEAARVSEWVQELRWTTNRQWQNFRWLTAEFTAEWQRVKPQSNIDELARDPLLGEHFAQLHSDLASDIQFWHGDLATQVRQWNAALLERERSECADFFETVEKSPLTDEQINSVVCFDNRVQVIASAGSGKTSTMVAKAGYALHRGLAKPSEVLLLAFNKAAAAELRERVKERLDAAGIESAGITADTFHSFGLSVIGKATGRKPSLAPWLESGQDVERIVRIVDELRDESIAFRTSWDIFRLVFSRDLPRFGNENMEPDAWDSANKTEGFRTLKGEIVRSQGERLVADWLFYNGVEYEYERPYQHDVADAEHRQYTPDFYYPTIDVYHEHWAVDEDGNPPAEFDGYAEGMEWKKHLHQSMGKIGRAHV